MLVGAVMTMELCEVSDAGRGLFATQRFSQGTLLWHVPAPAILTSVSPSAQWIAREAETLLLEQHFTDPAAFGISFCTSSCMLP